MNVKYLIPFIEAAHEVLQAETNYTLNRGKLSLAKGPYVTDELTVSISLVGDVFGTVFYSLNASTALKLVSEILGETMTELDNIAQSGIAELGNVITGRASVKLSQTGFESTISPPTLMVGKGAMVSTLDLPRLVVPLTGDAGSIVIHLALIESQKAKSVSSAQLKIPEAPKLENSKENKE